MKYAILLLLLAFSYGEAGSQTDKTLRTKRKVRRVDSVSTWQLNPLVDSTRMSERNDTARAGKKP